LVAGSAAQVVMIGSRSGHIMLCFWRLDGP
jgi:hypothetical protein